MNNNFKSWLKIFLCFIISFITIELYLKKSEISVLLENTTIILIHLVILLCIISIEYIHISLKNVEKLFKETQNKKNLNKKKINNSKNKWFNKFLTKWWIYTFYLSIVLTVFSLWRFNILDETILNGKFNIENKQSNSKISNYSDFNTNILDSIILLNSEQDLKKGASLFKNNCAVCHNKDGGGGIGPNLTDNYWILGGGTTNIYKTITYGGRENKGMIEWSENLSKIEISQISIFINSLKNTNPENPKIKEGDFWSN